MPNNDEKNGSTGKEPSGTPPKVTPRPGTGTAGKK